MKYIALLLVTITFASCMERSNQIKNSSNTLMYAIRYDTLIIKGVPHEFIINRVHSGYHIIHSPECPCLKNKED